MTIERMSGGMLRASLLIAAVLTAGCGSFQPGAEDSASLPAFLQDRGSGSPTSMFGTYCRKGELLVYPFYEYYINHDQEYSPAELGYGLDQDFRAKYEAHEVLLFLCYGITEDVNVEFEIAPYISAVQFKSPLDPTLMPPVISESGLGDVQMEINWRWKRETATRPDAWSYLEIVFPSQKNKVLIGTSAWEFKLGVGALKGFSWGTLMGRMAIEYDGAEGEVEMGEYAIEYLRRLSPQWRLYCGIEGSEDEVELIIEAQWHLNERTFIKLNNAVGISSKAPDWAPEIGVMVSF